MRATTTIATDGKTIAADGLRVNDYRPTMFDYGKVTFAHGRMYALAGLCAMFDALIAWHDSGADPAKTPPHHDRDNGWVLLVIDDGVMLQGNEDVPYFDPVRSLPFAIGSGRDWALAAMKFGRSPEEAVRFAAENDIYTGGQIVAYDIAASLRCGALVRSVGGNLQAAE